MSYIILHTFVLVMSIILSYHMSLCLELHVVMFATSFRVLGTCVLCRRTHVLFMLFCLFTYSSVQHIDYMSSMVGALYDTGTTFHSW
jgi:hypothetical protein